MVRHLLRRIGSWPHVCCGQLESRQMGQDIPGRHSSPRSSVCTSLPRVPAVVLRIFVGGPRLSHPSLRTMHAALDPPKRTCASAMVVLSAFSIPGLPIQRLKTCTPATVARRILRRGTATSSGIRGRSTKASATILLRWFRGKRTSQRSWATEGNRSRPCSIMAGTAASLSPTVWVPTVLSMTFPMRSRFKGVAGLTSVEGRQFDFVMLAHVLEHCSEPRQILQRLKPLGNRNTLFYFEVPHERPSLEWASSGRLQRHYLNALLKIGPLLKLVDLYSTVCRVKFNRIPPLALQKCSEHLNFFTESSLKALLDSEGFELLESGIAPVRSSGPVSKILYGLASIARDQVSPSVDSSVMSSALSR